MALVLLLGPGIGPPLAVGLETGSVLMVLEEESLCSERAKYLPHARGGGRCG